MLSDEPGTGKVRRRLVQCEEGERGGGLSTGMQNKHPGGMENLHPLIFCVRNVAGKFSIRVNMSTSNVRFNCSCRRGCCTCG